MTPTTFDILALSAIFISTVLSAMRGLVAEIVSFTGWIAALIMARIFAIPVSDFVFTSMNPRPMAVICAFVLVYVAARLAVLFIQQLIEFVVKSVHLSKVNRVLGAILGAGKGIVAVTLVTLACSFSNLPQSSEWQESISAPFFESLAMTTKPYLPDFLAEQVAFHHENNSSSIADENIAPETKQPVLNNSKKNIKK